jgi:hypothetical protein
MAERSRQIQFSVLQRELRETLRRNHPNPHRVNCMASERLAALARGELDPSDPAYDHVLECSPCYEETVALSEQFKAERAGAAAQKWRTIGLTAIAAAAAILAFAMYWNLRTPSTGSVPSPEPVATRPAAPISPPPDPDSDVVSGVVNLQIASVTRGESSDSERGLQKLPRKRMKLRLYLPVGMEEGSYDVRLRPAEGGPAKVELSGVAHMEDGLAVLRVQPDLTNLAPGRYTLDVRQKNRSWRSTAVSLE